MKKVLRILLMIPILYLIIIPVYFARTSYSRTCSGIEITLTDTSEYHFVTKKEILNLIYRNNGRIVGMPVKDIQVSKIERGIDVLRELKIAEVYMSINGTLHVYAVQRVPLIRVIADDGGDYFMDKEGVVVRRRHLYTPRLHIVGGNVTVTSEMIKGVSVLDTSIKNSILKDIYYLVDYIKGNSFWSAQIDQIYVDRNSEIDLVPRIGNHIVHLGTADDFALKLTNLEVFYKKVLPEVGWNKYSVINLEYKDQIVCQRR